MELTLPLVTGAAIADSINPCAISVLLLTISFLLSAQKDRRQIWLIAGTYVLGIFVTYISIGLGILRVLSFFGIPQGLSKFGAVVIIISGLISLAERYIPGFPIKLAIPGFIKPQMAKLMHRGTFPAMFGLGILVGLFEFPCTGGPYLLILTLLHDSATFWSGFAYLVYYNLIFVSPLLVILALASSQKLLDKYQNWRKQHLRSSDTIAGILMVAIGVIILLL